MNCLVPGCENDDSQGLFVGRLCAPCSANSIYSQRYKNVSKFNMYSQDSIEHTLGPMLQGIRPHLGCDCVVCVIPLGPGWGDDELRRRVQRFADEAHQGLRGLGDFVTGGQTSRDRGDITLGLTQPPRSFEMTTVAVTPLDIIHRTIRGGDLGLDVLAWNRFLGISNNFYGTATKLATRRFQGAEGLYSDGICGPKTLAAAKRSLATT